MPDPDPPPSAIAAATSPDWATRVAAAQQLAAWADRDDIAPILHRLVTDPDDTAVVQAAALALLGRNDVRGVRIVAGGIAALLDDDDLMDTCHADHLCDAVGTYLFQVAGGHAAQHFVGTCNALSQDPDSHIAAGAAKLLDWIRLWEPAERP